MQLHVAQTDWGKISPDDIETLLKDVASDLNQSLRNPFEELIKIKSLPPGNDPVAAYRESPDDPFCIYLSARNHLWCKFAYQFAHEFCHVLSGYEGLKDNPNNWFHEAICELASVFTLRCMAEQWPDDPPYLNQAYQAWYAQELKKYSQDLLSCPEAQLPEGMTLQTWLSSEEESLREKEDQRKKNALVAYKLLPIFESTPEGWNAIRSFPNCTGSLEEYLVDWYSSVDTEDKPFVARLSKAFDYTIG